MITTKRDLVLSVRVTAKKGMARKERSKICRFKTDVFSLPVTENYVLQQTF